MNRNESCSIRPRASVGGLLPLLVLLLPAVGRAEFTWATNDGRVTITRYTGPGVAQPGDKHRGRRVFLLHCLTNVTFGAGVTTIGRTAFAGCTGLRSVTIPNGVAQIAGSAFENCTALGSITIPDSVTELGVDALFGCTGLTNAILGAGFTTDFKPADSN